ncbi:histidine phosphatase family protein [Agromyces larvae]|uniref:Histidine phosphatase family protein n=1 Tax=Agromyces larvae TaxID=2929802 RepID=A0ABY4C172_9MICO|nr:histidine phosphatase family protein [Agromyces larvae]UOE44192.1 histidine phosphatase family protein [Agromyces larvae]
MTIALIRHGQTDWNAARRLQGRSDVPLNDTGRAQARDAASLLAAEPWDLVVSSTLARARETAAILAEELALPVAGAYHELVEQDYGVAEGMLVADMRARWPERDIPGMESDDAVRGRALDGLARLADAHPGARVLAVAHGTFIRHALAAVSGHAAGDYPPLANLSASVIVPGEAGWRVETVAGAPFADLLDALGGRAA